MQHRVEVVGDALPPLRRKILRGLHFIQWDCRPNNTKHQKASHADQAVLTSCSLAHTTAATVRAAEMATHHPVVHRTVYKCVPTARNAVHTSTRMALKFFQPWTAVVALCNPPRR